MLGLLGQGFEDPKSAAIMALSGGLLRGDFGGGLLGANQAFTQAQNNILQKQLEAKRMGLLDAQLAETLAQADERKANAQKMQEALALQKMQQEALPKLFRQSGMIGGEARPQEVGGVPMFSKPMGVTPMSQTPGGFDVMGAINARFTPEQIRAYAGLADLGRQKVARTVKGIGPDGREYEYQVDEFGQRVGDGLPQYRAPLTIAQGDRNTLVDAYNFKPVSTFPINMSPAEKDSSERGWATFGETKRHNSATEANAVAGKAPPGYRFKSDGSLEAIPGGPADMKAGELGAKNKARQDSAIAQADSVLQEVRDAKGLVGWNTAGVGGLSQFIPATEGRNLSAKLQTIKANLGFDRLQQMRDQSPTGGALGAVAVQELAALQATVASLDQLQSPAQIGRALDKIERHYTSWRNTVEQARSGSGGATGGWDIREKR